MEVLWRFWVAVVVGLACSFVAVSTAAASDVLLPGGTLTAGQFLTSADGHYELTLQGDGNLVLYVLNGPAPPRAIWQSGTAGDVGDSAVLQSNGNLLLVDASGQALWSTNATASGCTNLKVQDDGNLVLYTAASPYWASGTVTHEMDPGDRLMPGEAIFSPGEHYELIMQTDGNLVLYSPTAALWASGTYKQPGNYAIMRTNGNLVVVNSAGADKWVSGTNNNPGAGLSLLADGNMQINSGATTLWQTRTWGSTTGNSRFPRPAFTPCPAPAAPPPPPPPPPPSPPQAPVVSVPVKSELPKLRVKMTMDWTWNRGTTRLHRLTLSHFPRRALLIFACHGKGCARHATKSDWRHLNRTTRSLDGRRYRAGNNLLITVWERGFKSELVGVQIRWGALPKVKLLR